MALEVRAYMAGGEQASILDAMKDQWTSMVGMAGMFIATILIGLSIQPVYDIPEARAFGEAGASKGGFGLWRAGEDEEATGQGKENSLSIWAGPVLVVQRPVHGQHIPRGQEGPLSCQLAHRLVSGGLDVFG